MNQQIKDFARETIKKGLAQLPESNQLLFKRMYSHNNLNLNINKVVDLIPDEQLNFAMTQVANTLAKSCNNLILNG